MKKIRILYVLGAFTISGGVESMVENIIKNIDHEKFQIDFLLFNGADHSKIDSLMEYDLKIYYIDTIKKGIIKFIYNTYRILKNNKYDIIHTHINEVGFFSLLAGVLAGTPVRICHSHNTKFSNQKLIFAFKSLLKLVSNYKFACSEAAGKALFGNNANFTVIKNAIDAKKYLYKKQVSNKVRKSLGIENKFVIGHVGRFANQKNHMFILKVFKEVVKVKENSVLLLIGDGELKDKIYNEVKRINLEKNVIFLGARKDVHELLQGMDVFLFPSHYEGLAIVLIEAQCASLPCFVSDVVTREVEISNLINFISLDKEPSYWANKILSYLNGFNKVDMYEKISRAGYDIKTSVARLEDLYISFYSKEIQ
jgi:glycosyltransferase EpsF